MSAVMENRRIPATWDLVPLKELGQWSGGGTPSKSKPEYWEKGKIPWVSPKDMKTERITDSEDHITKAAVEESTAKLISAGSVLIVTRSGILSHTLPVAVTTVPVTVNQDLKALTPKEGVLPEYVAWALRSFARDILNSCSKQGTTVNSIETAALHRFEIPVAPLDQQKRIVTEIEKQSSRLDEAVANLKRVKANLKRYKAAVLKAAVEGRLVEPEAELARREGRSYETGEKLLQRILETRRSQWKGKGKYKEPAEPETTVLPELPEGWVWATVGQLALHVQYGYTASAVARESGVRFLRITDIQEEHVDWSTVPSCDIADDERRELLLQPGDIVFARTGATVGKSFQLKGKFPDSVFASYLIRISPSNKQTSDWLNVFFHSSEYWQQIRESQAGIGQPNVNGTKLRGVVVPLPPLAEQHCIVTEVDRRQSLFHALNKQIEISSKRAARLRQSILEGAFSGQLIASHLSDEPVSVLLERIRASGAQIPEEVPKSSRLQRGKEVMKKTKRELKKLVDVLKGSKKSLSPEQLFTQSGYAIDQIDQFYEALRHEVDVKKTIEEHRPDKRKILLRLTDNAA